MKIVSKNPMSVVEKYKCCQRLAKRKGLIVGKKPSYTGLNYVLVDRNANETIKSWRNINTCYDYLTKELK